ncbi:hypothetical protein JCM11641_003661 [Rhodosporidiobolus odoratus]
MTRLAAPRGAMSQPSQLVERENSYNRMIKQRGHMAGSPPPTIATPPRSSPASQGTVTGLPQGSVAVPTSASPATPVTSVSSEPRTASESVLSAAPNSPLSHSATLSVSPDLSLSSAASAAPVTDTEVEITRVRTLTIESETTVFPGGLASPSPASNGGTPAASSPSTTQVDEQSDTLDTQDGASSRSPTPVSLEPDRIDTAFSALSAATSTSLAFVTSLTTPTGSHQPSTSSISTSDHRSQASKTKMISITAVIVVLILCLVAGLASTLGGRLWLAWRANKRAARDEKVLQEVKEELDELSRASSAQSQGEEEEEGEKSVEGSYDSHTILPRTPSPLFLRPLPLSAPTPSPPPLPTIQTSSLSLSPRSTSSLSRYDSTRTAATTGSAYDHDDVPPFFGVTGVPGEGVEVLETRGQEEATGREER